MAESDEEMQSVGETPTWSVATVLTIFVATSLLVERSINRLGHWLQKNDKKQLFEAVEKMKEELMLLGCISLLLTATSGLIANLCIPSKYYNDNFIPCSGSEIKGMEESTSKERKLLGIIHISYGRVLEEWESTCKEGHEPFLSYEGLEQLHRFIFVMAVTHISYSCLTMLLAIMKIHSWKEWEVEAHREGRDSLPGINIPQRQSTFVKFHNLNPFVNNSFLIWLTCFSRQFGRSVVRADYLTLRKGFIVVWTEDLAQIEQALHHLTQLMLVVSILISNMNHSLASDYDFHGCMIRSTEEEFQRIVGLSAPLWAFVVAFMLFNVKGTHLYFWIAIIPLTLVLVVGTKLQFIIATLVLENASISSFFSDTKLTPRDDLFWFKKPELLLSLIHFILFQNAFEMASFVWFWWQFGYNSCFIGNHVLVYFRLAVGFAGQFLCSYSTLPLYALVTQMGTNYKKGIIPRTIRETMDGWGKAARKKRRHGFLCDDVSTSCTENSTIVSIEDDHTTIELQPASSSPRIG